MGVCALAKQVATFVHLWKNFENQLMKQLFGGILAIKEKQSNWWQERRVKETKGQISILRLSFLTCKVGTNAASRMFAARMRSLTWRALDGVGHIVNAHPRAATVNLGYLCLMLTGITWSLSLPCRQKARFWVWTFALESKSENCTLGSPGLVVQLVGALFYIPKVCGFNPLSGHIRRL